MSNDLQTPFDETALAELNFFNIVHREEVFFFVTEILKEELQLSGTDLFIWHLPYCVSSTIFNDGYHFDYDGIYPDGYPPSTEVKTLPAALGLKKIMPYLFYLASLQNCALKQYFQDHLYLYSNFSTSMAGFKKIDDEMLALLVVEISHLLLNCQVKNKHMTMYYIDKLELDLLNLLSTCDRATQEFIPTIEASSSKLFKTTSFLARMDYSQLIQLFTALVPASALGLIECLASIIVFQQEQSLNSINRGRNINTGLACSHEFIYFSCMYNLRTQARQSNMPMWVIDKIKTYTTQIGLAWEDCVALGKIPDSIMNEHVYHVKSIQPVLDVFLNIEKEDLVIFDSTWQTKTKNKNQNYFSYLLAHYQVNQDYEEENNNKNNYLAYHPVTGSLYRLFNESSRLLLSDLVKALSQLHFEPHEIEKIKYFIFSYDEVRTLCFHIQQIFQYNP